MAPKYKVVTEAPSGGVTVTSTPAADQVKGAGVGGGPSSEELIAIGVAIAVIVLGLIFIFVIYRYRSKLCKCSKSDKPLMEAKYHAANNKEEEAGYNGEPVGTRTYVV